MDIIAYALSRKSGGSSSSVGGYSPPSNGIPKSDLAQEVRNSLAKAESALQYFTESDPVYSADKVKLALKSDVQTQIQNEAQTRAFVINTVKEIISKHIGLPKWNGSDYILTFTADNGVELKINIPVEILSYGLDYDQAAAEIVLTKSGGAEIRVSVADLVDVYCGSAGENIQITVENNVIHAKLLAGAVGEAHLTAGLLAKINSKANSADLETHAADNGKHITSEERGKWNGKLGEDETAKNSLLLEGHPSGDFLTDVPAATNTALGLTKGSSAVLGMRINAAGEIVQSGWREIAMTNKRLLNAGASGQTSYPNSFRLFVNDSLRCVRIQFENYIALQTARESADEYYVRIAQVDEFVDFPSWATFGTPASRLGVYAKYAYRSGANPINWIYDVGLVEVYNSSAFKGLVAFVTYAFMVNPANGGDLWCYCNNTRFF